MSDTTIPLDQLGSPGDDGLRRDRWGRLFVTPPGGGKPEGYTRVTTVAKTTDDGGGLMPWKATAAVVGTMRRRGIRAKWEALLSSTGGDPWYFDGESKAKCKKLVEESSDAGGAIDRRDQGTALHAITAQIDAGEKPMHLSAETEADIEAYVSTLAEYGIEVIDGFIETTVVLDSVKVGGTFDRLVRVRGRDLPMIADLKTGEDLSYSWGSFAVQLAAYAHGEAIFRQGPTAKEDQREMMPTVDRREGLIIHLPAGSAKCELYVVDLEEGWRGFELSLGVREWRKLGKGLGSPLSQWVPAEPMRPTLVPPIEPTLRGWLQERIDIIGKFSPEAMADLGRSWPVGMPTLRSFDAHTAEQLDLIERTLDAVEAKHEMPFGASKPTVEQHERRVFGRLRHEFPGATLHTSDQPESTTKEQ